MKTRLIALWCGITVAVMLASAQSADEAYPTARVVSFEKLAANAQHPEESDHYKISMRLCDTVYVCHASAPASFEFRAGGSAAGRDEQNVISPLK